jgi:hypothetical protein
MRLLIICFAIAALTSESFAGISSWKGTVHVCTAPVILGSGIYASTRLLQDSHEPWARAGAVADLSFLTLQTGLGATILLGNDEQPLVFRTIHRIVGIGVIASGLWISIAGSMDEHTAPAGRYAAYGHTALAAVPLILFSF